MDNKKLSSGQILITTGQPVENFWYISSGKIKASFDGGSFTLSAGNLIGIVDFAEDSHSLSYTALEDTQLVPYGTQALILNQNFFKKRPENATHFSVSLNNQIIELLSLYDMIKYRSKSLFQYIKDTYHAYNEICEKYHIVAKELPAISEIAPLDLEQDISPWYSSYYNGMKTLFSDADTRGKLESAQILIGYLYQTSDAFHNIVQVCNIMQDYCSDLGQILLNEDRLDLFDLLTSLYYRVANQQGSKEDFNPILGKITIMMENQAGIPKNLLQARLGEHHQRLQSMENFRQLSENGEVVNEASAHSSQDLSNALQIILEYSECLPELAASFSSHITAYKELTDKNSTEPDAISLRKGLTQEFHEIYSLAFQNSLLDQNIPPVLKMFFHFGFVDAELAGTENALYLHDIVGTDPDLPEHNIYTIYNWLLAIYRGEFEPSTTELDSDYQKYIQELVASNKLTRTAAEKMKDDASQKVMFELNNLFPSACKVTSGHLTTYCPILSEHQLLRQPSDILLFADKILQTLDHLCEIDYTLFYHDAMTIVSEKDNIHDYFHQEIRPVVILAPVVGVRGSMWQEISGRNQLTPARMLLPIFELENLEKLLLHMSGEYRWEMCKRAQGSHWNDVSDPSLTSLYYDYLQFFKRNNELSSDAKNKIKIQLGKCKQNYREYFIQDYMTYMQFEANGSPKLNKLARNILFSQCPFSAPIRESLSTNPLYSDLLDKAYIRVAQRKHFLNNLKTKLLNSNQPVPDSLIDELAFYEK